MLGKIIVSLALTLRLTIVYIQSVGKNEILCEIIDVAWFCHDPFNREIFPKRETHMNTT